MKDKFLGKLVYIVIGYGFFGLGFITIGLRNMKEEPIFAFIAFVWGVWNCIVTSNLMNKESKN